MHQKKYPDGLLDKGLAIFIISVMLYSPLCFSRSSPQSTASDTTLARHYVALADSLAKESKFDSSNFYFEKASSIYKKSAEQNGERETWARYIQTLENLGKNLIKQGQYKSASEYLTKALQVGLKELGEDHVATSNLYTPIGEIHYRKGEYDKALGYFEKSLSVRKNLFGENDFRVAQSYNNIGLIYETRGEYKKALDYYDKALTTSLKELGEHHQLVAICYSNLGNTFHKRGDYDRALEYLNKSLTIERDLFGENCPGVGSTYNNIATVYSSIGDYDVALDYFDKSLAIRRELFGENHPNVALTYNNIGSCYEKMGDHDGALEYFSKSLKIYQKLLPPNHPYIAISFLNMGIILGAKEEYDRALEYLEKSLAIQLESMGENTPFVAATFSNIGRFYSKTHDFEKAEEYLNKSLTINKKLYGNVHPDVAKDYLSLAQLAEKQDNLKKALEYLQDALISLVSDFNDADIYSNPALKNVSSENLLLDILAFKAKTFENLYSKTSEIKDVKMAYDSYSLAVDLIDRIRGGYKAEGSKLLLGVKATNIFDEAIDASLKLYRITRNDDYKQKVFFFIEKSKASVLLSAFQESRAKKFAGIPDSLLEQEKEMRLDLTSFDTQIQKEHEKEKPDSLKLKELESGYFALNNDYQEFIERLESEYPKYYALKYQTGVPSPSEVQAALDDHSALVDYFIGDSLLTICVLTNKSFNLKTLSKDSSFDEALITMIRAIKKIDGGAYRQSAFRLHSLLIEPILPLIGDRRRLVVIPHGDLNRLPFEALLASRPADKPYHKLDYLVRRFDVGYHYSATLFLNRLQTEKALPQPDMDFLAFAPVFRDQKTASPILAANMETVRRVVTSGDRSISIDGKSFNELPYSDTEVRRIIRLFDERGKRAVGYFDDAAQEETLKNMAGLCRYLHLATHSFVNQDKPELSGIVFSQPQDSLSVEDGILYSGEIYNLDLAADLVVLSSCESGIGKQVRGEGMLALTRGFLYAGAKNLLVSLWKVSDRQASDLMSAFYRNLLEDNDYCHSLRQAKLELIANPVTAFPKLWSGFIMIGE